MIIIKTMVRGLAKLLGFCLCCILTILFLIPVISPVALGAVTNPTIGWSYAGFQFLLFIYALGSGWGDK